MALKQLVEAREELKAERKSLGDLYAEAGGQKELDLSKIKSIKGDDTVKLGELRKRNEKVIDLQKKVDKFLELEDNATSFFEDAADEAEENRKAGDPARRHDTRDDKHGTKDDYDDEIGIGELIVRHQKYKNYIDGDKSLPTDFELKDVEARPALLKALFQTSAGWAPESVRSGRLVPHVTRPIRVIDVVPGGRTSQAAYVYMEETTLTEAAAERLEGGEYPESEYALTERSETVRSIGHRVPVTDEQLEDVPGVRSYLDLRLNEGVRRRLDTQLLNGNGTSPNLRGINNFANIQTQNNPASGNSADALFKGITKVQVEGRAFPNVYIMHPTDWERIRLMKTTTGEYLWGPPYASGETTIWGLRVVVTDAQTVDTALVCDTTYCQLFIRRNVEVAVGYIDKQFAEGKRTIRCGMRCVFVGYRGTAFCKVSNLDGS